MKRAGEYTYLVVENDIQLIAEKHTLIDLARMLREVNAEGTWSDLAFQIEWEFDVDGIRTESERDEEEYIPSSTNGDYSPSNPWDAPGMSIKDFIR